MKCKFLIFKIVFFVCAGLPSAVYGVPSSILEGDLVISKEPLTDPLPDGDPVAYLSLHGENAKKIYSEMKTPEYANACGMDGVTARVAGNLICYKQKEENFLCSFGIRLTDGTLTLGKPC